MKEVRGTPILLLDSYISAVEREAIAWLHESLVVPIVTLLEEHGVPTSPDVAFLDLTRANDADWVEYPPAWRSLGLSRADLPQIPPESRGALLAFLAARGITATEEFSLPAELKPSQSGYYAGAVERARDKDKGDRAVLVSSDGFVLDGHHRFTAARLYKPDEPIRTLRFDAPIKAVIRNAHLLPTSFRENATNELVDALRDGRVHYADGVFSGTFNAAITRELRDIGARFQSGGTFRIRPDDIPVEIRGALAGAQEKSEKSHAALLALLALMLVNLKSVRSAGPEFTRVYQRIRSDLDRQLVGQTTIFRAPQKIRDMTAAALSAADQKKLVEEAVARMEKYLVKYAENALTKLVGKVEDNLGQGGRVERLGKLVDVTIRQGKGKSHYLAHQETSLMVAEFREVTARAMGGSKYLWRTKRDERVRPTWDYPEGNHRRLEGHVYEWEHPPVTIPTTGSRAHPGEDPNCRCWAIPFFLLAEDP